MIKEVKRVKKWRGVFGVFLLCLIMATSIGKKTFAITWGSESATVNVPGCDADSCYSGAAWVHYTIKSGERGQVGSVPGELNIINNNGKWVDGPTLPSSGKSCSEQGNGFWVLQQVTYKWRGTSGIRRAFGVHQAKEINESDSCNSNSSICYVSYPVTGVIDDAYVSYNNAGATTITSGSRSTYDTTKLEPDGFENDITSIVDIYNDWKLDGDPSWSEFKTGGGSWFCGGPEGKPDDEDKTVKFEGKVTASVLDGNLSPDGTYGGYTLYNGFGVVSKINTPATGKAEIKRLSDDVPGNISTKFKFIASATPPSIADLNSSGSLTSPFSSNSNYSTVSTLIPSGGTAELGITDTPELRCFSMRYTDTITYTGSGNNWTESGRTNDGTDTDCIAVKNYNAVVGSFTGNSSGSWNRSVETAVVPMQRSGGDTVGTIQATVLTPEGTPEIDDATGEPVDAFAKANVNSVQYGYEFTHTIKLDNKSELETFFGHPYPNSEATDVKVEYKIYQTSDDDSNEKVVKEGVWGTGASKKIGDWVDMAGSFADRNSGTVEVRKDEYNGRYVCQYMEYTKTSKYVTESSGLKRETTSGETDKTCIYIGVQVSRDDPQEFEAGSVVAEGDTLYDDASATNLFTGAFKAGSKLFKATDVDLMAYFPHKMWLDASRLSFNEELDKDHNGQGVPFVKGNDGSVKDYTDFKSSYVAKGELEGLSDVVISPQFSGGVDVRGVLGFGLDFELTDISNNLFNVVATHLSGGALPIGGNKDSNPWASGSGPGSKGSSVVSVKGAISSNDLYILAGELKSFGLKTVNSPHSWKVFYNKVGSVIDTNTVDASGTTSTSSSSSTPYKITFSRVEPEGGENESSNVSDIVVHRDYNFKIENFRFDLNNSSDSFGKQPQVVTAGEKANLVFSYDWTRSDKNNRDIWGVGDSNERKFITDVFKEKTRAYLVHFEIRPGINANTISSVVRGGATYNGDGDLPTNNSGLKGWIEGKLGGSEIYEFGSDPIALGDENDPFKSRREQKVYSSNLEQSDIMFTYSDAQVSNNAAVGGKYCFGIYVENAMNDGSGVEVDNSNSAVLSELACANVVKKPSMEVWGGDVATNGGIQTSTTRTEISPAGACGSWGDFGLIANNTIKGMSSGRAIKTEGSGASNSQIEMARISPITIANRNNSYGNANIEGLNGSIVSDLLSRYGNGSSKVTVADKRGEAVTTISDIGADCPDLSLTATEPKPCVILGKDVEIASNIMLPDRTYGNGDGVLQALIVAEGTVTIRDDVERVDAWIVANGKVDTCYNDSRGNVMIGYDGMSDTSLALGLSDCSQQLKITGPVIGSKVAFDRAFGEDVNEWYYDGSFEKQTHGTGFQSLGVSAETIDFSPAAILFGAQESDDAAPRTTYIKKLAPRY